MVTYKGLPGPNICDFRTREGSAANYDARPRFQIGRIDMVANTGTYLDSPFHRYADGKDLSGLAPGFDCGPDRNGRPPPPRRRTRNRGGGLRRPRRLGPRGADPDGLGRALENRPLFWRTSFPDRSAADLLGDNAGRSSASTAATSTICTSASARFIAPARRRITHNTIPSAPPPRESWSTLRMSVTPLRAVGGRAGWIELGRNPRRPPQTRARFRRGRWVG